MKVGTIIKLLDHNIYGMYIKNPKFDQWLYVDFITTAESLAIEKGYEEEEDSKCIM